MTDLEVKGALVGHGGRREQTKRHKAGDCAHQPPMDQHALPLLCVC